MSTSDRILRELTVAEAAELLGLRVLLDHARTLDRKVDRIMSSIADLQAVDADLAAAVTELAGAVDRIDADFVKLQEAIANGDSAAVDAEVANLRATLDAARVAKSNIDTTDPSAPTT